MQQLISDIKNIIIVILLGLLGASSVYNIVQDIRIESYKNDVVELENAVDAYEELLRVIPFNHMVKERIFNANDEINATLSNTSSIADGSYRM